MNIYESKIKVTQKEFHSLQPIVYDYLKTQRNGGGLGGDFSAYKLLELTELLEKHKPKNIIELGGGSTSMVFALYAANNPNVRYISIDESSYYQELTRNQISAKMAVDEYEFIVSERIEFESEKQLVCMYSADYAKLLNEGEWFCYIDGPSAQSKSKGRNDQAKLPCIDIIQMIKQGVRLQTVVFDCRFDSVRYCLKREEFSKFDKKLHFRAVNNSEDCSLIDPYIYHSILTNKFEHK